MVPYYLRHLDVSVGIDLVALHNIFVGNFLARVRVHLGILMRWPVIRLIWLKLIFSESEVAGYNATGQVTRERRKSPSSWRGGQFKILQNVREPGFKTILPRSDIQIGVFNWRNT
jgi:hypothetical protein